MTTTFMVTRHIPGAGSLGPKDFQGIAQTSIKGKEKLPPEDKQGFSWDGSGVTGENEVCCIIKAESEEAVRRHSDPEHGDFPISKVTEISEDEAAAFLKNLPQDKRFGPQNA